MMRKLFRLTDEQMERLRPPAANASFSLRCPHAQSSAVARARVCWPMCWSVNMPTICHSTARARSSSARGSTSTAPRWPTGPARAPPCWNPWPMRSGAMSCQPRRSSQTTRPSACSLPAPVRPRRQGSGPMPATNAPGAPSVTDRMMRGTPCRSSARCRAELGARARFLIGSVSDGQRGEIEPGTRCSHWLGR